MKKIIAILFIIALTLNAFEFRAYDVGGSDLTSQTKVMIKGKEYTLIPFSNLNLKVKDINLDGDFTLVFPIVNGKKLEPLKLASNYKNQVVKVKVFNEDSLILESEELYLENEVVMFHLNIEKD